MGILSVVGKAAERGVSGAFLGAGLLGALACCGLLVVPFIVGPLVFAFFANNWLPVLASSGAFVVGGVATVAYWRRQCACRDRERQLEREREAVRLAAEGPRHSARWTKRAEARRTRY